MTAPLVIRASVSPGEVRVALLQDDTLLDYRVERPSLPEGLGDLHRARMTAAAPAMDGFFVLLGGGISAWLAEAERPPGRAPTEGQSLAVRVTRAAQGGKGPRVTARLSPEETALASSGGSAPALVRRGPEAALAMALAHPGARVETDGAMLAARLRGTLGAERVRLLHGPAFDEALEADVAELSGQEVALPGGGRLLIQPTAALTAIDIDAGTAAGARDGRAQEHLNAAALREAARQIRLRNLSGAIFLDMAGLSRRRRAALAATLREALAADPRARLVGMTGLGFAEIVRTRAHAPLHEVLGWPDASPLTLGLAALRGAMREAAARPGRRLALRAAPAVLDALRALPSALDECASMLGAALELRADPRLPLGSEVIEEASDGG